MYSLYCLASFAETESGRKEASLFRSFLRDLPFPSSFLLTDDDIPILLLSLLCAVDRFPRINFPLFIGEAVQQKLEKRVKLYLQHFLNTTVTFGFSLIYLFEWKN